ncbi:MAG TPA: pyridoxamine 5'-phosphate oxidase family protein [Terriglobales bacterium]|nr:pyridoxamine 5'-phosphate oxidase family protein [Terriglobales bacterium]
MSSLSLKTSGGTNRGIIRQHPERSAPEARNSVLLQGQVAHVAFNDGDQVVVVPFTYHFDPAIPDRIFLHGGQNSRAFRVMASGAPVCVEVTIVDGLVYSRDALYHSVNYRSCVCFGRAQEIREADRKAIILRDMIRRYFPGREEGRDYVAASEAQLHATALFEVMIEESSTKMRAGGPKGPNDNSSPGSHTFGIVELKVTPVDPRTAAEAEEGA